MDWRWEDGRLGCHDPATGLHIATFETERARADSAEAERNAEHAARTAAEARLRVLEAELHRLRGG